MRKVYLNTQLTEKENAQVIRRMSKTRRRKERPFKLRHIDSYHVPGRELYDDDSYS